MKIWPSEVSIGRYQVKEVGKWSEKHGEDCYCRQVSRILTWVFTLWYDELQHANGVTGQLTLTNIGSLGTHWQTPYQTTLNNQISLSARKANSGTKPISVYTLKIQKVTGPQPVFYK